MDIDIMPLVMVAAAIILGVFLVYGMILIQRWLSGELHQMEQERQQRALEGLIHRRLLMVRELIQNALDYDLLRDMVAGRESTDWRDPDEIKPLQEDGDR